MAVSPQPWETALGLRCCTARGCPETTARPAPSSGSPSRLGLTPPRPHLPGMPCWYHECQPQGQPSKAWLPLCPRAPPWAQWQGIQLSSQASGSAPGPDPFTVRSSFTVPQRSTLFITVLVFLRHGLAVVTMVAQAAQAEHLQDWAGTRGASSWQQRGGGVRPGPFLPSHRGEEPGAPWQVQQALGTDVTRCAAEVALGSSGHRLT